MPSKNPDVIAAYQHRYYLKNKERLLEKRKGHYLSHREHHLELSKNNNFRRRYNLTTDEVNALAQAQGNKCAICQEPFGPSSRDKHLDHCHSTGSIRKVLCRSCNHGLGNFKDNINLLEAAIAYLNENQK